MNQANIKELLFAHFAGRTTALQRTVITDWLQSPANQMQYVAWLDEWERQNLQYIADDDTAFRHLTKRVESWEQQQPVLTEARSIPMYPVRIQSRWLVAAAVLLCLLVSLYAGRDRLLYQTIETAYGETRQLTLPDGSQVMLNAHSVLRIPRFTTDSKKRAVWLTGEAAFSIQHTTANQPFVVHANRGVEVVVLGTEFDVYDRPEGTKVVLSKGAIQLNYTSPAKTVRQYRLKPGDAIRIDPAGQLTQSHTVQPGTSIAWRNNRFVFNGTSVREIAALLQNTYGIRVILTDPALANRTVTGSFQAQNADEFLQVVAQLLEINYKQKDNSVTFFD